MLFESRSDRSYDSSSSQQKIPPEEKPYILYLPPPQEPEVYEEPNFDDWA